MVVFFDWLPFLLFVGGIGWVVEDRYRVRAKIEDAEVVKARECFEEKGVLRFRAFVLFLVHRHPDVIIDLVGYALVPTFILGVVVIIAVVVAIMICKVESMGLEGRSLEGKLLIIIQLLKPDKLTSQNLQL